MVFNISYDEKDIEFVRHRILQGDVPRYLYKYRNEEQAIRFLINQEIYFSNYKEFNDPFEGSANLNTDFTPQQFFYSLISGGLSTVAAAEVTMKFKNGTFDGKNVLIDAVEEAKDSIGYYCMSSRPDNLLMWAHYANSHYGVCFKFDILEDIDTFLVPVPIEYNSDFIDFNVLNSDILSLIRRKSRDWEYEQEVRIIKPDFHGLKKVKNTALKEIIFGCRTCEGKREEIMKEALNNGFTDVAFSEAIKSDSFELLINSYKHHKVPV